MEIFLSIMVMLVAIGFSNMVNHILPFIPVPLIQIALGVVIAVIPGGINIPLEPDLFFVLFIAPLLFNDGRNVSRATLWHLRKQILLLALGLVFLTVLVIGYLTHWLIPSIPLSAAFALAAVLSPTDIVAVSAILSRVSMPKSIMSLLEGEGLMNDASGLVAFNFAVAATVTGIFSLADASLSFLMVAIGGFAGGVLLAFVLIRLRIFIRRLGMEDVTIHMLIQILTPFMVFLVMEHFHLSGILAVVAAGIVHAIERDHEQSPTLQLRVVSKSTWTVLVYVLNGLVFVLLGLQMPDIASEIFSDSKFNNIEVIIYTFIITLSLFLLRFIWIYLWRCNCSRFKKSQIIKQDIRTIGIITISGVRGSVTLAAAFSIPLVLADGRMFPGRSLIIFIATGVILMTLVVASIFLPMLTSGEEDVTKVDREQMERKAMIQTQEAAIRVTREAMNDENRGVVLDILSAYNRTLHQLKYENTEVKSYNSKELETEIRMKALVAESEYLERLIEENQVDKEIAYLSQVYINRREVAATNRLRYRGLVIWASLKKSLYQIRQSFVQENEELQEKRSVKKKKLNQLNIDMAKVAIQAVKKEITPQNKEISYIIIGEYNKLVMKFKSIKNVKEFENFAQLERELQDKAFQAERDEVQNLYEKGKVTKDITRKIRKQINIREAYFMDKK